tara:strand:- start:1216 stop:1413 length:198 start_codon:yes stop_codon:yes gene_type:complete
MVHKPKEEEGSTTNAMTRNKDLSPSAEMREPSTADHTDMRKKGMFKNVTTTAPKTSLRPKARKNK